jgi:hypothetical protein
MGEGAAKAFDPWKDCREPMRLGPNPRDPVTAGVRSARSAPSAKRVRQGQAVAADCTVLQARLAGLALEAAGKALLDALASCCSRD